MGITDEAYAKAIQKQREKIKGVLDSTVTSPPVSSVTLSTTTGALHYPTNIAPLTKHGHIGMKSEDLDHEAAKVSLDVLKNMWIMRWQDKWVNKDEITEDDFWRIAFVRLENVNKLERHILADNMQYVYRIIE